MPVLITGATGLVGRALAERLIAEGGQVRAYIRRDDPSLRSMGIHVAIGAIDDVPRLESALTQVHTIVHLVGGWWPEQGVTYDFLNRESTECAVIAARAAEVRRFVFLSSVGADPESGNEYLASKGKAEAHIAGAELEYAIFRLSGTSEGLARVVHAARRGATVGLGTKGSAVNPVALRDVIQAVVAADSRKAEVHGVWELGGSRTVTLDEFVASTIPGGRLYRLRTKAPRALVDLLARGLFADSARAVEHFDLQLTEIL